MVEIKSWNEINKLGRRFCIILSKLAQKFNSVNL